jgi:hypothetical protein
MKKKVIAFALMAFIAGVASPAFAQEKQDKQKHEQTENKQARFAKFKSDRINYLAKVMGLTDDEKAKFQPIEADLQQKKFDLYKELREESRNLKGKELSDADHQKLINLRVENKKKEADLEAEYISKMLNVLPAAKVSKYASAEQSFGKHFKVRKEGDKVRKEGDKVRKEGNKAHKEGDKARKEAKKAHKEADKAASK